MASLMNIKESKGFCDEIYPANSYEGKDLEGEMFGRHLSELADQIEMR